MMAHAIREYFGGVDASKQDAADLDRQFVRTELFDRIVGPDAPEGAQVVVGLKGTGKTALGRVAMERFAGLKWFRSEKSQDYRFEIPANNLRSGVLMGMIKVFIVEQLIEQLLRDGVVKRTEFEKFAKFFKNMATKFAKATEVNAGFISFKPEEFFDINKQRDFAHAWESSIEFLRAAVGDKSIFVVLDDVDTYFVGLEDHPRFIEGLCRAVNEINAIENPRIFCLLLLKQGVWRTLFEKPEEYDKIKQSMEFLKWDLMGCTSILTRRIAGLHNKTAPGELLNFRDAVPFLALEFDGNAKAIEKCVEEIFSYSANGPRDVIDLCNNIKRVYPSSKITIFMVEERAANYSEEKLYALNGDFGHLYADLPQFVQTAFEGFRAEFSGTELANHLEGQVVTDPKIGRQAFAQHNWFKDSTTNGFVKKLFDVGIIGIVQKGRAPLFASESDTVSQNTLVRSQLVLHKAYRPALGFD